MYTPRICLNLYFINVQFYLGEIDNILCCIYIMLVIKVLKLKYQYYVKVLKLEHITKLPCKVVKL